jgi:hypothetical protein
MVNVAGSERSTKKSWNRVMPVVLEPRWPRRLEAMAEARHVVIESARGISTVAQLFSNHQKRNP